MTSDKTFNVLFSTNPVWFFPHVYGYKFCSAMLMQMLSTVISTRACVGRGRVCLFLNTASTTCHTSQTLDLEQKGF